MLSRRNIRIKVLQQLYAYTQQDSNSLPLFSKQLDTRFKEFYQFYYFNLQFLDKFNTYLESEKEIELEKYFPNKNVIRNTEVFSTDCPSMISPKLCSTDSKVISVVLLLSAVGLLAVAGLEIISTSTLLAG